MSSEIITRKIAGSAVDMLNLTNPEDMPEWTSDFFEGRPQIPLKILGTYGKRNKYGQQNSIIVEVTVEMWGRMLHALSCLTSATGDGYDSDMKPIVVGAYRWMEKQTKEVK